MSCIELLNDYIRNLVPYSSARDEFQGSADVFLDANESWYGGNDGVNRYPDPRASLLRKEIEEVFSFPFDMTAVGNGSDEIIDMLIRMFCTPGKDSIMIERPTYGAYKVFADINNVRSIDVPLLPSLELDADAMLSTIEKEKPKMVFICSPNNPTGRVYPLETIIRIADSNPGITVVDEAYADFAEDFASAFAHIEKNDRVVVLRTLSKAWGIAGARIGIMAASPDLIQTFIKAKAPYNVSSLSQIEAARTLSERKNAESIVLGIRRWRKIMAERLAGLSYVREVFPSEANFLLIRTDDADSLCSYLREHGIVIRNRTAEPYLSGCVRITIGSADENLRVLEVMDEYGRL